MKNESLETALEMITAVVLGTAMMFLALLME